MNDKLTELLEKLEKCVRRVAPLGQSIDRKEAAELLERFHGPLVEAQRQLDDKVTLIDSLQRDHLAAEEQIRTLRTALDKIDVYAGSAIAVGITHGAVNWREGLEQIKAVVRLTSTTSETKGTQS